MFLQCCAQGRDHRGARFVACDLLELVEYQEGGPFGPGQPLDQPVELQGGRQVAGPDRGRPQLDLAPQHVARRAHLHPQRQRRAQGGHDRGRALLGQRPVDGMEHQRQGVVGRLPEVDIDDAVAVQVGRDARKVARQELGLAGAARAEQHEPGRRALHQGCQHLFGQRAAGEMPVVGHSQG